MKIVRAAFVSMFVMGLLLGTRSVSAQYKGAAPVPENYRVGFDAITKKQSKQWLSVLAGPEFSGRGTGQPGYTKAAHWVAGKLAEFGFQPIGDGGTYFQHVPMNRVSVDIDASSITGPDNLKISGADELGFRSTGGDPSITGKIVVVNGNGVAALETEENLEGKILILVEKDTNVRFGFSIRQKRPAAMIRISETPPISTPRLVQEGRGGRRRSGTDAVVTQAAAERLMAAIGADVNLLKPRDESGTDVTPIDAELTIEARMRTEQVAIPNVVAWYPGSDPEVNHEYVTIGAHLDHLGQRGNDVYPGADDNGSGSTAILQVAHAISSNPVKPRRSVLYIGFAAEEMGLIGSRYYCENPLLPLKDMVCMINMDMVGRAEETENETAEENRTTLHLIGSKRGFKGLHELVIDANKFVNFTFEYDQESVFNRSDQASFFRKGIPVTFVFGGFHPQYHRPTDTLDHIDFRKVASAAKLDYLCLMLIADHGHFEKLPEAEGDGQ